jgi:hypothetical protein
MDIEDQDDVILQVDEEINRAEADDLLEDECCYCLYKMLRGKSVGRRLKRKLFKFAIAENICGFGIFCITAYEDTRLGSSYYVTTATYGSTLLNLQYAVAFLSLIIGIPTALAVKYWGSMVTNRNLLVKLMYINLLYLFILFVIMIWCVVVLFLTFRGVNWSKADGDNQKFFLPFIFTILFLCPYIFATPFYIMDFSVLLDDVELNGVISEPDVDPREVKDLSGFNLKQFFAFICAIPLLLLSQLFYCFETLLGCLHWCTSCGCTAGISAVNVFGRANLMSSSFFNNVRNQTKRVRKRSRTVIPDREEEMGPQSTHLIELKSIQSSREPSHQVIADEERLENERLANERLINEKEQARIRAEELERKAKEEEERQQTEAARLIATLRDVPQNEPPKTETQLSGAQFRSLWSVVETAGSFQCKIKFLPSMNAFTEHMKRQGFHVVFATMPATGGLEVGISNIRNNGDDPWFMARFIALGNTFSAVMKCQDPTAVEKFVKKFALAKILKIDT